ncbi:hypothetical protein LZ198_08630 [Myxococcus sp. K15C18031901]|uniref:YfiM family protein n=1 Tax=Myxococcus dinghuensis TaxID=2906761 RepID=UPI0020A80710|nr:hypothetical protein [Myxococcus dinghuensis]MCP3098940.1 hypothetical protein [Myxococcus dinghuensis]
MRPLPVLASSLALLLAPRAHAASGDDWFGPDKPKHFAACFTLAGVGYAGGALLLEPHEARYWTSAGLAMGVGVGKELYDLGRGTRFSLKDLAWDAVGTATGLTVSFLVDRLIFGPPPPRSTSLALRRDVALVGGGGVPGWELPRSRLDEAQQLLAVHQRIHGEQRATEPHLAAVDEDGDLAARALPQTAGGHDVDAVGQASLGERALQPARQLEPSGPQPAPRQALAAHEDLDVLPRLLRVTTSFIPHPASSSPGASIASDAPLRARRGSP